MTVPYTRQLGSRSGVQVNPIKDETDRFVTGSGDQVFCAIGSFKRGRTDKAFLVTKENMFRLLGKPFSPAASAFGETYIQLFDAFKAGASAAVITRLSATDDADLYCNVKDDTTNVLSLIADAAKVTGWKIAFKHLENFAEGIRVKVNATANGGDPSKEVTLIIIDKNTGKEIFNIKGSLDPEAVDEFNQTTYLPAVASSLTDLLTVEVATGASFASTFVGYGNDVDGTPKYATLDLVLFTAGTDALDAEKRQALVDQLYNTEYQFKYVMMDIVAHNIGMGPFLSQLAKDQNKKLVGDIPATSTPSQVVTAAGTLNFDTLHCDLYWSPIKRNDLLNGGKITSGVCGDQIGKRCARNARINADGIPPMNYPVAGKEWPLTFSGMSQLYTCEDSELNDLADARVNPIQLVRYNAGSRYVYVDSLTTAKTNGVSKLINVSEMGITIDDWMGSFANEALQLPIDECIKKIAEFGEAIFEAVETAKWIKPSEDLEGASWTLTVRPNTQRPDDAVDVRYGVHYVGTARAVFVSQTFSK